MKHFSVKKGVFSEKRGGNSVNEGFGKDFYRKGNSVKRSGPFTEPPDSEIEELLSSSPSRKSALMNSPNRKAAGRNRRMRAARRPRIAESPATRPLSLG